MSNGPSGVQKRGHILSRWLNFRSSGTPAAPYDCGADHAYYQGYI